MGMKLSVLVSFASCVLPLFLAHQLFAQKPGVQKTSHTATPLVGRGKYLVENVGMCADCHTPRGQNGEFLQERWLRGGPIEFKPTVAMPEWADQAPDIAGLQSWTREAAIKFFMTGTGYNGRPARPPMPQFRLNRSDAEAVVAYLKSLQPK